MIYEYRCERCNEILEKEMSLIVYEKFGQNIEHNFECRGILKRIISPLNVHYKGSGWTIKSGKKNIQK